MKFSCIVGTYNPKPEWLARALASAEGLFDEILIVDDGSTQPIPNAIRHESNKGFYAAKNTAIKAASGDVIATLDDDDYFDREGVVKLKRFIEETPGDIYHFHLQCFGTTDDLYGCNAKPTDLPRFNAIPGISWYRRMVWEEMGGFTYPLAEDWDFWAKAHICRKRFVYFPETVYHFNRRNDSVSASWSEQTNSDIRRHIQLLVDSNRTDRAAAAAPNPNDTQASSSQPISRFNPATGIENATANLPKEMPRSLNTEHHHLSTSRLPHFNTKSKTNICP